LGTMQAGQIAVPLSVPLGGVSDERVSSVLGDASPSVILTTSPVAGTVAEYVKSQSGYRELVRCLLMGLAPLIDDDDKLLRALIESRYRRAPTPRDLLGRPPQCRRESGYPHTRSRSP